MLPNVSATTDHPSPFARLLGYLIPERRELWMVLVYAIGVGVLNLLEAIRFLGRDIRLYNSSSSECFGAPERGPPGHIGLS